MLPVLNAEQLRATDAHAMSSEPIASVDLMERAADHCAQRIIELLRQGAWGAHQDTGFLVIAGMGNNGGDGLVIARLLHGAGYRVRVIRCEYRQQASPDNAANWERLLAQGVQCISVQDASALLDIQPADVIIDAIFGTGLTEEVPSTVASLIHQVRKSDRPVVAIDLPSGLFAEDNTGIDHARIMRATLTLTLEFPKLALLLPENAAVVGVWELIPIGLDHEYASTLGSGYTMVLEQDASAMLRPRPQFGHKGTFGHALIVAGSTGRAGAAVLATRAALRSGTGLVTAHVPGGALDILQISCPEAMCSTSNLRGLVDALPDLSQASAVGIGPGLGSDPDTALVLKRLIQECVVPLVLDADALNILAENRTWRSFLPPGTILTPHPKEFDRMEGSPAESGYQRLQRARAMAGKEGVTVVLKGAWTAVCAPSGEVFFNSTGNPGMAKGGSGDALTGLLTGLLAQGYAPLQAAIFGVYLHGLAGDLGAMHKGMDGMHAGDLIDALPEAWKQLRNAGFEEAERNDRV
ncbi:MAG: NAD(P)H-hydrate dehydratase [Flavobacteriales bacterium]